MRKMESLGAIESANEPKPEQSGENPYADAVFVS
jgi:hypothetical protein